jgi:hypothetical protein
MTAETFGAVVSLAKSPDVGAFFVSCAYEPSINPLFPELLRMIPCELRGKSFFSTNLSLPMTEETLFIYATANLSYMNISVESFDSGVYERFRDGASREVFVDNLSRLVRLRRTAASAPALRFVIMLFKQNAPELERMIARCLSEYGAELVEIRTPFDFSLGLMSDEFKSESLLTYDEAAAIRDRIDWPRIFWRIGDDPVGESCQALRISADGTGWFEG